jgi:hypothetical protein
MTDEDLDGDQAARSRRSAPACEPEVGRGRTRRRAQWLLKVWSVIALGWVIAAGSQSVRPITVALRHARVHHAVTVRAAPFDPNGPLPTPPDSPDVAVAKVVARQAAIVVAPPLLLLWFGWDVWFAVAGFLDLRLKRRVNAPGQDDTVN